MSLLACRWIERHRSQPQTEFLALVNDLLPIDERSAMERLILQKSLSAEKAEITIDRDRNAEMVAELEAFDRLQLPFEKPTRDTIGKLDEILRHWAEGGQLGD